MTSLVSEWRKEAPTLYKFLLASANACEDEVYPLSMAGSILLKTRNIHMSAVQLQRLQHCTEDIDARKVFHKHCGRFHTSFKSISADPFTFINANPSVFYKWLKHRVKEETTEQDLSVNLA